MVWWVVLVAVVAALVIAAVWASRRGWISLSMKRSSGATAGALGQVVDIFQPSHSYVVEERERPRLVVIDEGAPWPDPPDAGSRVSGAAAVAPTDREREPD